MNEVEVFDKKTSEAILASTICIPGKFYESATSNIRKALDKQRDFDQCHLSNSEIKMGDLTLLHNNKEKTKGRRFSFAWLGPYIISEITPKGVTTHKKRDTEILKGKYNLSQLQLYVEEKTADTGSDFIEFTMTVDNEKTTTSVNTRSSTSFNCNEINNWDFLPKELVEKVLLFTIKEIVLQICHIPKHQNMQEFSLLYVTYVPWNECSRKT